MGGGGRPRVDRSVRAELAAGDNRLLHLAWLLCVQGEELDEDALEPPVPPGLAELSGPLRSLAEFLRLDQALLDIAAEASAPLAMKAPSATALTEWVKQLPAVDKDDVIVRLLRGDGTHLRAELLRRYDGGTAPEAWPADGRWANCWPAPRCAGLAGNAWPRSVQPPNRLASRPRPGPPANDVSTNRPPTRSGRGSGWQT
ncbi:hypothetical protein AB0H83_41350 [Dactylosporangium sp. NPDC050688]|uniref:hypothetical protein n=1 Tax=Dactylosporangium sp. NPDC050688 TaxID=3157217 RepID=UPI0033D483A3